MQVSIIGAGISGLLSALELVEQGVDVIVYDAQDQGQASWAGGGILSPMYPWRYPKAVNDLARHAPRMYQHWNEKLQPLTGIDFDIHQTGMLILDETDRAIGTRYAELSHNPLQVAKLLQQPELQQQFPELNPSVKQALYFPHLANVRNPRLLASLRQYLSQHPRVQYHLSRIVEIEHQAERITHVMTEKGEKHRVDQVLFTAGAWTGAWLGRLGIHFEIQPIHGQMLLLKAPPNWLRSMCMNRVMYLIPRRDGHIVCGSSMTQRGFDLGIDPKVNEDIYAAALEMVPALAQWPIVKTWAGFRPGSPDGVPRIGKAPAFQNAWVNIGHFRNGLCMGPAAAQLLRQLMLGQAPSLDPTPYQPE